MLSRESRQPEFVGSLRMWAGVTVLGILYLLTWTGDGWGQMFLYCHQFLPHPALSSHSSSVAVKNRIWKCPLSRTGVCPSGFSAPSILIEIAGWYRRSDSFSFVAVCNGCAWDWNPICQVLCLHSEIKPAGDTQNLQSRQLFHCGSVASKESLNR